MSLYKINKDIETILSKEQEKDKYYSQIKDFIGKIKNLEDEITKINEEIGKSLNDSEVKWPNHIYNYLSDILRKDGKLEDIKILFGEEFIEEKLKYISKELSDSIRISLRFANTKEIEKIQNNIEDFIKNDLIHNGNFLGYLIPDNSLSDIIKGYDNPRLAISDLLLRELSLQYAIGKQTMSYYKSLCDSPEKLEYSIRNYNINFSTFSVNKNQSKDTKEIYDYLMKSIESFHQNIKGAKSRLYLFGIYEIFDRIFGLDFTEKALYFLSDIIIKNGGKEDKDKMIKIISDNYGPLKYFIDTDYLKKEMKEEFGENKDAIIGGLTLRWLASMYALRDTNPGYNKEICKRLYSPPY